jgi:hypothetical protein
MLVSWRDQASYSVEDIAAKAGMTTTGSYGWTDIAKAVEVWGLFTQGPASAEPPYWADLMREVGPLWVVEVGAPYHAIVVSGIEGDGSSDGTTIAVNNPWPPQQGEIQSVTFSAFENDFELGSGANTQIVIASSRDA